MFAVVFQMLLLAASPGRGADSVRDVLLLLGLRNIERFWPRDFGLAVGWSSVFLVLLRCWFCCRGVFAGVKP